jgi:hypothetical protein
MSLNLERSHIDLINLNRLVACLEALSAFLEHAFLFQGFFPCSSFDIPSSCHGMLSSDGRTLSGCHEDGVGSWDLPSVAEIESRRKKRRNDWLQIPNILIICTAFDGEALKRPLEEMTPFVTVSSARVPVKNLSLVLDSTVRNQELTSG